MVNWQDGTKTSDAHVNEDGTITEAEYEGTTPVSAHNLNLMQKIDIADKILVAGTVLANNKEVELPLQYQVRQSLTRITNRYRNTSFSNRHKRRFLQRGTEMREN